MILSASAPRQLSTTPLHRRILSSEGLPDGNLPAEYSSDSEDRSRNTHDEPFTKQSTSNINATERSAMNEADVQAPDSQVLISPQMMKYSSLVDSEGFRSSPSSTTSTSSPSRSSFTSVDSMAKSSPDRRESSVLTTTCPDFMKPCKVNDSFPNEQKCSKFSIAALLAPEVEKALHRGRGISPKSNNIGQNNRHHPYSHIGKTHRRNSKLMDEPSSIPVATQFYHQRDHQRLDSMNASPAIDVVSYDNYHHSSGRDSHGSGSNFSSDEDNTPCLITSSQSQPRRPSVASTAGTFCLGIPKPDMEAFQNQEKQGQFSPMSPENPRPRGAFLGNSSEFYHMYNGQASQYPMYNPYQMHPFTMAAMLAVAGVEKQQKFPDQHNSPVIVNPRRISGEKRISPTGEMALPQFSSFQPHGNVPLASHPPSFPQQPVMPFPGVPAHVPFPTHRGLLCTLPNQQAAMEWNGALMRRLIEFPGMYCIIFTEKSVHSY